MAGVSSLLKSAASRRQKIQDQADAYAAFQWESSAQTYDDFVQYSRYLKKQASKTSDPGKALSYQSKIRSSQRSYTSNEIQRQTQAIRQGAGSIDDKMNAVRGLYQAAVSNGDMNLAQNIISTWDSLSIQKQTQDKEIGGQLKLQATQFVKEIQNEISKTSQILSRVGLQEFEKAKGIGYFDYVTQYATQGAEQLKSIIEQTSDPDAQESLIKTYNSFVDNGISLPGANGSNINVSLNDLVAQNKAASTEQSIYTPVTGPNGVFFKKNEQTGVTKGRNAEGGYDTIPLYNPGNPESNIFARDDKGNIKYKNGVVKEGNEERLTPKQALEQNGFQVFGEDNNLSILNTGNINGFYGSPFPTGTNIQVTVGPNGELQLSNGDEFYNLDFNDKGEYTGLSRYLQNAITQYNGNSAQFNRPFYAGRDLSGATPDLNSLVGLVDLPLAENYLDRLGKLNFSAPGMPMTPSTVLQNNVAGRSLQGAPQVVQSTISPQATANNAIQSAAVNPFSLPKVPVLKVSKPIPQPKVKVAPVQNQNLTGVSNYQPTQGISLRVR